MGGLRAGSGQRPPPHGCPKHIRILARRYDARFASPGARRPKRLKRQLLRRRLNFPKRSRSSRRRHAPTRSRRRPSTRREPYNVRSHLPANFERHRTRIFSRLPFWSNSDNGRHGPQERRPAPLPLLITYRYDAHRWSKRGRGSFQKSVIHTYIHTYIDALKFGGLRS